MGKNNFKWTLEKIQEEALKYQTRGEFQNKSNTAYQTARKRGFLNKVCSHMPKHVSMLGENNPSFKWTNEMLREEALKYRSRAEFRKKSINAYSRAKKKKILNEICSHMKLLKESWSREKIKEEALKYKTRIDFQKMSKAYTVSQRRGILDEICSHMKVPCGTSRQEKELLTNIKNIYSNAAPYRDMKIKIQGKPHIKGFHIDIYIPELRKGIEFDGTYYHSFDVMRKSKGRADWTDEDVYNYHQIKDDWFASKGIQILHVKEEDWKKDKQACIDRCLSFLRGENVLQVA